MSVCVQECALLREDGQDGTNVSREKEVQLCASVCVRAGYERTDKTEQTFQREK